MNYIYNKNTIYKKISIIYIIKKIYNNNNNKIKRINNFAKINIINSKNLV